MEKRTSEEQRGKTESKYVSRLRHLVRGIYVSSYDSKKLARLSSFGGFYVIEDDGKKSKEISEELSSTTDHCLRLWVKNPNNFRDLIKIIASNSVVLKRLEKLNVAENDLRNVLCLGADEEISGWDIYRAHKKSWNDYPQIAGHIISEEDIKAQKAGLQAFKKILCPQSLLLILNWIN